MTALDSSVLNWSSSLFGTADGYGNSAERMIQALDRSGQTVCVDPGYGLSSHESLIGHVLSRTYAAGVARIAYSAPNDFWRKRHIGQATIGFTMWEDDTLPPPWNDVLHEPDAIAAPSQFCCDVIQRRLNELHLEKPVFKIPLGVAHAEFPYRRRAYNPASDTFVFLWSAVNVFDTRKGVYAAIAAFQDAFTSGERVKLIMRTSAGRVDTQDARIEWRVGPVTEQQKLDVLYEAHACVYPTFGEGFGLMPLEAISTGLPAICSDNSALTEYRNLFLPIGCDPEPSGILGPRGVVETKGTWMRPRRDELARAMREMIRTYEERTALAASAVHVVRAKWGYEHTVRAIQDAVEQTHRAVAA